MGYGMDIGLRRSVSVSLLPPARLFPFLFKFPFRLETLGIYSSREK